MRFKDAFIGGSIAAMVLATLPSCQSIPSLSDKIGETRVFAMIGEENRTDGFLTDVFVQTDAILIRNGMGGELDGMLGTLAYLDENPNKLIVIDGPCASACTLLLSRPENVVFTENAVFQFHSAAWQTTVGTKVTFELSEEGNQKMLRVLPESIREWVLDNDAFASRDLVEMSNRTVRKLIPAMFMPSNRLPLMDPGPDRIIN